MANWQLFLSNFSAKVKNLTAADGLPVWKNFVDKADEKILLQAIEKLGEICALKRQGNYQVTVKLPDLEGHYFELWRGSRRGENGGFCSICGRAGFVTVVQEGNPGRVIDPRSPEPFRPGSIGIFVAPCVCDSSKRLWTGVSYEQRQENVRLRFTDSYDNSRGRTESFTSAQAAAWNFINHCIGLYERQQTTNKHKED